MCTQLGVAQPHIPNAFVLITINKQLLEMAVTDCLPQYTEKYAAKTMKNWQSIATRM